MICFCKRLMFHVREDGQKKHLRQVLKDGPLLIRLHDSPCLGKALFQTISSQEIFQTLGKGAKGNSGDSSHDAASSKTSDGNMPYSWASPRMMARSFGWALMYLTKWGRRPSKICAQEFLQVTCCSAFLPICVEVLKAGKKRNFQVSSVASPPEAECLAWPPRPAMQSPSPVSKKQSYMNPNRTFQ